MRNVSRHKPKLTSEKAPWRLVCRAPALTSSLRNEVPLRPSPFGNERGRGAMATTLTVRRCYAGSASTTATTMLNGMLAGSPLVVVVELALNGENAANGGAEWTRCRAPQWWRRVSLASRRPTPTHHDGSLWAKENGTFFLFQYRFHHLLRIVVGSICTGPGVSVCFNHFDAPPLSSSRALVSPPRGVP